MKKQTRILEGIFDKLQNNESKGYNKETNDFYIEIDYNTNSINYYSEETDNLLYSLKINKT